MNKIIKNLFEKKHKGTVFALCIVCMLLAGCFYSCSKKECPKEPVCNVNNPLTDLLWLKEIVNKQIQGEIKEVYMNVYQCTYNNGIDGFYIEPCIQCNDYTASLRSCEGIVLFDFNGTQHTASDFEEWDIKDMKLIWTNYKP